MNEYGMFYERYRDRIFAFLLRKSGDRELSEDLTQESFIRHLQHYWKKESSPYILYAIARNALIDHRRKQRQVVPLTEKEEKVEERNAEELLLVREQHDKMAAALDKLSKNEQKLLSLAATGMRYARIAAVLGYSEANVKVQIHRARGKLKKFLQQGEGSWNI